MLSSRAPRLLLPFAGFSLVLLGQQIAAQPAPSPGGGPGFRALRAPVISPDGAWAAAEERPDRGDGSVRVWSTEGGVTFTIERGQDPRISRDSRWVSALQNPVEDSGTPGANPRAGRTLVLLDLQDGSRRTFDFVLSYDMTYASTYLLYLQSPETTDPSQDSAESVTTERTAGTLHQVPLNPDRLAGILRPYEPDQVFTRKHVVEFAAHPANDHFAYVFHDPETGGQTLHIVKWGIRAWYKGGRIEGLCWAGGSEGDESIALGFLDSTETAGKDGTHRGSSALYTWEPAPADAGSRSGAAPGSTEFTRVDTPR